MEYSNLRAPRERRRSGRGFCRDALIEMSRYRDIRFVITNRSNHQSKRATERKKDEGRESATTLHLCGQSFVKAAHSIHRAREGERYGSPFVITCR